jgi:Rieske Fe-S protein
MAAALNRRTALSAAAVAGVGVPLLAGCGSDDPASTGGATDPATPGAPSSSGPAGSPSADGAESTGGDVLAKTTDVPVGGCAVYSDAKVVVTQPSEGEFRCFTAVCTHQGCLVSSGSEGVIPCTCHGSQFSLDDGSPLAGPATAPLEAVEIVVDGDDIALA